MTFKRTVMAGIQSQRRSSLTELTADVSAHRTSCVNPSSEIHNILSFIKHIMVYIKFLKNNSIHGYQHFREINRFISSLMSNSSNTKQAILQNRTNSVLSRQPVTMVATEQWSTCPIFFN